MKTYSSPTIQQAPRVSIRATSFLCAIGVGLVGRVVFLSICSWFLWPHGMQAQDLNRDGSIDVLWHHKSSGSNAVWYMNGTNFNGSALLTTAGDPGWRMAGFGRFHRDASTNIYTDILWRHTPTGLNAVWFLEGPNGTNLVGTAQITPAYDLNWQIVGTGDFNRDGQTDILWYHPTQGTAVWLMSGTTLTSSAMVNPTHPAPWLPCAVGDMDNDGYPDVICRNQNTGQIGIWFMFWNTNYIPPIVGRKEEAILAWYHQDIDWKIVAAADFNHDTYADLLWRHATLGLNYFLFMQVKAVLGADFLLPPQYDTDWRMANQETIDSTWRLGPELPRLTATPSESPRQISLKFRLPLWNGQPLTATIERRQVPNETNWTSIVSGFAHPANTDTIYTDNLNLESGARYEYRLYRTTWGGVWYLMSGINATPNDNRGRMILLADRSTTNALAQPLQLLIQDLVGDGWTVLRHDVERHNDTSWAANTNNIATIKGLVRSDYQADPTNTKAVLIVGHVAIPYSGSRSWDGHTSSIKPPDHSGAWPCDAYYGDVHETNWTDNSVNYTNIDYPQCVNVPGDGKFDNNYVQTAYFQPTLDLAVGRIDFANLPALGADEATLLARYLNKDHRYRHKLLDWQVPLTNTPNRCAYYEHFTSGYGTNFFLAANATGNSIALIGDSTEKLVVGDFLLQNQRVYLLGYLSGAGSIDGMNQGSSWQITHTTAQFLTNNPTTVFCVLHSSYNADWNLSSNNFLRAQISPTNYGLAALNRYGGMWSLHHLAMGEHLGASMLSTMNDTDLYDPQGCRAIYGAIMGDLTLRVDTLSPPAGFSAYAQGNNMVLIWTNAPGVKYLAYRRTPNGWVYPANPFSRITQNPVDGPSFTDTSGTTNHQYMLRALKLTSTGSGTYTNISQGVYWP